MPDPALRWRVDMHLQEVTEDHLIDEEASGVAVVVNERQSKTIRRLEKHRLICNKQLSSRRENARHSDVFQRIFYNHRKMSKVDRQRHATMRFIDTEKSLIINMYVCM